MKSVLMLAALVSLPLSAQYRLIPNPATGNMDFVTTVVGSGNTNGGVYIDSNGQFHATATGGAGTLCWTSANGGAPVWGACSGSAATAFSALTGSTNTSAAMVIGSGASLTYTGTGTINAGLINSVALSSLGTGILKNTTATGVPSIAVGADIPAVGTSGQVPYNNGSGAYAADSGLAYNSGTKALGVIGTVTTGQSGTGTGAVKFNGTTSGTVTETVSAAAGSGTFLWPVLGASNNTAAVIPSTVTPADNDCAKFTVVGGVATLNTAGAACGSGGGTPTFPITVGGTVNSGGIPYFSGATTESSSAALTANNPVIGGGAGVAPSSGTRTGNTTVFATSTGALTNGHCLQVDANGNVVDSGSTNCGGGGSVAWSGIGNATADLTLANVGFNTTFNQTSATNWKWANTTAAVVGTSQSSPILNLCGTAFHGSASVADCLTLQDIPGAGNDAAITFAVGHPGPSNGTVTTTFPGPVQAGSSGGVGGSLTLPEGTAASASASNDVCYGDSTLHGVKCAFNNGSFLNLPLETGTMTSGDVVSVNATTNLIQDAGFLASNVVRKDASNTAGASMVLDMSAASATTGLRIPTVAGAIPTVDGFLASNLTNHTLAFGSNGNTGVAAMAATGTGTATTCTNQVVTAVSGVAVPTCTTIVGGMIASSTIDLTSKVTGVLPSANGGTGVNNTATLTLGSSNQNWATLGTGIVKNTTTTGALSDADATDMATISYVAGGGTAQAQTATYSPAIGSLAAGTRVCWLPAAASTAAAPTFAPNGLTAHTIVKAGGALVANDIITTAIACAIYDATGTQWELQNPQTVAAGGSGYTTIDTTGPGGALPATTAQTQRATFNYQYPLVAQDNSGSTRTDVSIVGACDPRKYACEYDEFLGTTSTGGLINGGLGFTINGTGGTGSVITSSPTGTYGVWQCATDTTNGHNCDFSQVTAPYTIWGNKTFDIQFRAAISATTSISFFGGVSVGNAGEANSDYLGIGYDTSQGTPDTTYMCVAAKSAGGVTRTSIAAAPAVDTGFHTFRIRSTTAGTILCSVDGSAETTVTGAAVPNTNALSPDFSVITRTTAARNFQADFWMSSIAITR